jgi:hypothetical protein
MVETFFKRSCTIHGLRQGPLAGHIDLLADHLAAHGFSRVHSRIQLRLVGHFNRWLEQKGISAEQLDENAIERYRRWLSHRKHVRAKDVCSLVRLLDLLREQRMTPCCTTKSVPTPREILLEKYRCYLRDERGLAQVSAVLSPALYCLSAAIISPSVCTFFGKLTPPGYLRRGPQPPK